MRAHTPTNKVLLPFIRKHALCQHTGTMCLPTQTQHRHNTQTQHAWQGRVTCCSSP